MDKLNKTKKTSLGLKIKNFIIRDVWDSSLTQRRGLKSTAITLLRIIITTINGIGKNRVIVQASSLSYVTLLATGPILAITILFSGMFFRDKGDKFIYEKIMDAAAFVMPAVSEIDTLVPPADENAKPQKVETANTNNPNKREINPVVVAFINKILNGGTSAGAIGVATMLITCLLLCKNMEEAFNSIWGVRKGRKWVDRIVFYFALIFFGSVGTICGMTFLGASQLAVYTKDIPFVSEHTSWLTYLVGMIAMSGVLAGFYKFIPCAKVAWRPAFIGGFIIMLLLMLNNRCSFFYISYMTKQQSFYGYLAIIAVIMFSLYIFWLLILLGAQITFAVQYMDYLSDDDSWESMGNRMRLLCCLAVFAEISREFYSKVGAPTLETLTSRLRLPSAAVIESLKILATRGLICKVEANTDGSSPFFKPAVSPDSITLAGFFDACEVNTCDLPENLAHNEIAVATALNAFGEFAELSISKKTIREIL